MFKKALMQADMTPSQAEILEYLYQNKKAKASEIATKIKRSRAIVYKEAEELIGLGIVQKIEKPGQVVLFKAGHPSLLQKLMDKRESQLKKDKELLNSYLPDMISNYNLANNRPGVRFFEGVDGLEKIYEEILDEGKDFLLVRPRHEAVYNEKIAPIVDKFIENRIKKNIRVTSISASDIYDTERDAKILLTKFNIDKKAYTVPVEIDIFGNKIAILSFGEELIGMIVDSTQIAQSMRELFMLATFASKNQPRRAD
jgi:predicted transcriptional regulator